MSRASSFFLAGLALMAALAAGAQPLVVSTNNTPLDRKALEALVKKTMADLKKGAKIEPLMKSLSEDPGSAESGTAYDVDPQAGLVEPFKNLSLRLKVGEVGAVKTQFGIHIIQRTE